MTAKMVTVFGGSGFLGRHVVQTLARQGYRIRVAVRRPHLAAHLGPLGDVGQIQLMQANIRHEASVARALEGADMAVNLIGIISETGKQKFNAVHIQGPAHIAQAARQMGVDQLIHVSALGADLNASSKYARSKAKGEGAVLEAFPNAVIVRPSAVFGREDDFFNKFAALARLSPCLPLIGGGSTRFQPVYAADVAAAIERILTLAKPGPSVFELGGPAVFTLKELMQFVCSVTGRRRALVPIPFPLAKFQAFFLGLLPSPLLTMDQVNMLKQDSVIIAGTGQTTAGTFAELGLDPSSVESVVPTYLARFRRHGQYEQTYAH